MRAKSRWTARSLPTLLLLASLAVARALLSFTGSTEAVVQLFPIKCPLRATTGIPCPTCGLGHALVDAWVGRWESSLGHHPLGLVALLLCTVLALSYLVRPESVNRQFQRLGYTLSKRPGLLIGAIVVYLLIGTIRALIHIL